VHIQGPHINGTVKTHAGGHGGGGDAVLASTGLGNDPAFPHALREQSLTHDVVGLVGTRVVEVFAFDVELSPPELVAEIVQAGEGRRTARVTCHQTHILVPEGGISLRCRKGRLQLGDGLVQNFRDKRTAKGPVISLVSRWKLKEFLVHAGPLLLRHVWLSW
jgi:hypothetical protein